MSKSYVFCAYVLSQVGQKVTVIERGGPIEQRVLDVDDLMYNGHLSRSMSEKRLSGPARFYEYKEENKAVCFQAGRHNPERWQSVYRRATSGL